MKFEGDTPVIERIPSGLFGLDIALADGDELGMPLRSIYEIYGTWGYGKSTLAYFLSGAMSKELGYEKIVVCDLEGNMDYEYVMHAAAQSGWDGTLKGVNYGEKKKGGDKPFSDIKHSRHCWARRPGRW